MSGRRTTTCLSSFPDPYLPNLSGEAMYARIDIQRRYTLHIHNNVIEFIHFASQVLNRLP
jgi:hypothetical protein